jgi:hypothetical protein
MAWEFQGRGVLPRLDRGAWAALSQVPGGSWSWPRAIVTIVGAMICATIIYFAVYPEPAFPVALAVVYAFLVLRARNAEARYGGRGARS